MPETGCSPRGRTMALRRLDVTLGLIAGRSCCPSDDRPALSGVPAARPPRRGLRPGRREAVPATGPGPYEWAGAPTATQDNPLAMLLTLA
jgi:hypothetical protein